MRNLAEEVSRKSPILSSVWRDQRRQPLINIEKKLALTVGDQIGDQRPKFVSVSSRSEIKKARRYGLSCWSECTDLNRGPLGEQPKTPDF